MQPNQKTPPIRRLTARGKNGIITSFKEQAEKEPKEVPLEISGRSLKAKSYEIELSKRRSRISSFIMRENQNKALIYKMKHSVEAQIVSTGLYTNGEKTIFHIDLAKMARRMTLRKKIIDFLTDKLNLSITFRNAISTKAEKGENYINEELLSEVLQMEMDLRDAGGFDEEAIQRMIQPLWDEYRDKGTYHKAKLENICYFLLHDKGGNLEQHNSIARKLIYLTNSNLETLVGFYCNVYNEEHREELLAQAKLVNREKSAERRKSAYRYKKKKSAAQKKQQCQKLRSKGYTQKQIAEKLGCTVRTVRGYWKREEEICV